MGKVRTTGNARGVTLMELLFALGLLALVASLSVPGFQASARTAAVRGATFELLAGLQQSRAQAILESRTTELCPADTGGGCLPSSAAGTRWRTTFEDADAVPGFIRELPRGVVVRSTRSPLSFRPHGLAASPGTLTICDVHGVAEPRSIVVSQTGRTRVSATPRGACSS
jgi:type IV fimbrial biogenesis protein FimT